MKVTFSPLRLQYAAANNPHVDGDQYETDIEVDGAPQTMTVTVSNHSSLAVGRAGDDERLETRLAAIVGQMLAESLPDVPAKMSIGVSEEDVPTSLVEMEDGLYLVPSL